jgi:murein DD-endopeptidase MepM/ murein hydrolase activator NlpD
MFESPKTKIAAVRQSEHSVAGSILSGRRASAFAAMAMFLFVADGFAGMPAKLKVVSERSGGTTRILLENSETTDMTATIEINSVNMRASVPLPHTLTVPAGKTVQAFTLTPEKDSADWSYSYVNNFTVGRADARHDDNAVYTLPFTAGSSFKCTQGYHGEFSHHGPDEFAVDFKMPEGTPIVAAREGTVVAVKDDSNKGGASRKYEDMANMVTVQHSDGTMAHYCHLAHRSAKVRVGQKVRAGDLLALSGNTGFTSGPHLHFAVFKARDGKGRQTIPVKFRTAEASGITLQEGKTYRAADPSPLALN